MAKWKRSFCGLLSAFFFLFAPVQSYASAAVAALAVGTYSFKAILAACGVVGGTAALAALFGSWDDMDTYRALGAARKLGAYAQRVYDGARDTASDAAEQFQKIEETLIACASSAWGSAISGIQALIRDLKAFLMSCIGYGKSGVSWQVPVSVPADRIWAQSSWSTPDLYPISFSSAPYPVTSGSETYFLTTYNPDYYAASSAGYSMSIKNWYYTTADLSCLFGVYDVENSSLSLYIRNAAELTYKSYKAYYTYVYAFEDGTYRYSAGWSNYGQADAMTCTQDCIGALPFPVFSSLSAAEAFILTGNAAGTYVPGTIAMDVDTFREDIAAGTVSDTLVLPGTADLAKDHISAIEGSYAGSSAKELEKILADAGIGVTVTDIPVDDTTVGAGDQAIVDAIGALPGDVANILADSLVIDPELAEEKLSLPAVIASKFPFCIPFDLIHLVQALSAKKEVPRFEIPIRFDYRNFHYDETFVVDMSVFDPAINIFRVMMDLLFCAGLIAVTRKLIRG